MQTCPYGLCLEPGDIAPTTSQQWPVLTVKNCYLIVAHSYPISLGVTLRRMFESRPRKVSREYIVVVSARKDSKKVPLPSVDHIVGGKAYYVARVAAFRDGVYSNTCVVYDQVDKLLNYLLVKSASPY